MVGFCAKIIWKFVKKYQDVQDPRQPDDNLYWPVQGMEEEGRPDTDSGLSSQLRLRLRWPVIASRDTEPEPASPAPEPAHMCSPALACL